MDESDSYASTSSYGPELTRTHPAQHLLLAVVHAQGHFFLFNTEPTDGT